MGSSRPWGVPVLMDRRSVDPTWFFCRGDMIDGGFQPIPRRTGLLLRVACGHLEVTMLGSRRWVERAVASLMTT